MGKMRRLYKRYERSIMLGIVIILLATFSVTSALCGPSGTGPRSDAKLGGSFFVSPGEREEVSDSEFNDWLDEYNAFMKSTRMPTLLFREHLGNAPAPGAITAAWSALAGVRCAIASGYKIGPHQLKEGVRDFVSESMNMRVTDELYNRFLRDRYQGSPANFQQAVKNALLRDGFISPLIDVARYAVTYDEAYDEWKRERERVDLEYIALSGEAFAEIAKLEERSRIEISKRESKLLDVQNALSQLRSLVNAVETLRGARAAAAPEAADSTSHYPEALDELVKENRLQMLPKDPWGGEWTYARAEDGKSFTLASAGPDKQAGTPDDVTRDTQRSVITHGNLRDVVRAVYEWHGAAVDKEKDQKWPASLEDLLKPAFEGGAAPLPRKRTDGHDREFSYTAAADASSTPKLTALGADGEPGTADDVVFTFVEGGKASEAAIPVGPELNALMSGDQKDAWERPLVAILESAAPITWRVFSTGPDGKAGTDDDVEGGNRREMEAFYAAPEVRSKYRLTARRQVEALHVQLPVFPDSALRKLWDAYPQHRPTSEEELFKTFKAHRGPGLFYEADDPRDAESGHGAELAKRIAKDGPHFLVPDASIFPADLGAGAKKDEEEPKDPPKEGEDGDEEGQPEPDADEEALRKEFRENGWREILIRERFMDNLLVDLLQRVTDSQKAADEWERSIGDEPDDAPVPARPEVLTMSSLLAGELNPYLMGAADSDKGIQSFRYYRTEVDPDGGEEQGDERTTLENHPEFGDTIITVDLSGRTQDGEYITRVLPLHRRKGRMLLRSLKYFPARDQTLDEVEDEVFEQYVVKRQLDRAVSALKDLQEAAPVPAAEEDRATRDASWEEALKKWGDALGRPFVRDSSGLFIGNSPPQSRKLLDESGAPLPVTADVLKARRQNFIWRSGYDTIRALGSRQDPTNGEPGTFGRRVLRDASVADGGTGAAFLIRVGDRVYPTQAEFSPRRYTDFLSIKAFGGQGGPRPRERLNERQGAFNIALSRFAAGDVDFLRGTWGLKVNSPLERIDR